jgi:hypothetical protein
MLDGEDDSDTYGNEEVKLGLSPLAVQVGTSRMITGFYHDLDRQRLDARPRTSDIGEELVFQPYSVRFTFHCYRA